VQRYIFRRLLQMIPIVLGISVLMFTLLTMAPGDPVDLLISSDPRVKPEDVGGKPSNVPTPRPTR